MSSYPLRLPVEDQGSMREEGGGGREEGRREGGRHYWQLMAGVGGRIRFVFFVFF